MAYDGFAEIRELEDGELDEVSGGPATAAVVVVCVVVIVACTGYLAWVAYQKGKEDGHRNNRDEP